MGSTVQNEELFRESMSSEGDTNVMEETTAINTENIRATSNSDILARQKRYLPPELVLRIIQESVWVRAGTLCVNLSILLCCRDWLSLAQTIIWKNIRITAPRVRPFLISMASCDTSTTMKPSYLNSLTITADPISIRELSQHISGFTNLKHLNVTQLGTGHRSAYDMVVHDLILKLPASARSLELFLPTFGFPKRCDHFCSALKSAMKQLHDLRIVVTTWAMADALARLKNLWTQKLDCLEQFSLVIPLGIGRFDACDPIRQIQFLREITGQIYHARGHGKFPKLRLCRISAHPGKIESLSKWRKGQWPGDKSTTFDAVQNEILSCPLVRLSERQYGSEGKGLAGLFWTKIYTNCRTLRGAFKILSHGHHEELSSSAGTNNCCLVMVLGTIDDLRNVWEGQTWTTHEKAVRRSGPALPDLFVPQTSHKSLLEGYDECLTTLDEEEAMFVRDQEESQDPSKLPQINVLL